MAHCSFLGFISVSTSLANETAEKQLSILRHKREEFKEAALAAKKEGDKVRDVQQVQQARPFHILTQNLCSTILFKMDNII